MLAAYNHFDGAFSAGMVVPQVPGCLREEGAVSFLSIAPGWTLGVAGLTTPGPVLAPGCAGFVTPGAVLPPMRPAAGPPGAPGPALSPAPVAPPGPSLSM